MAALNSVRKHGKFLVIIVALALFAFIAEEFVRSLGYTQNERHQRVGQIYGENISIQDFNKLVDEYTEVIKFSQNVSNLTDEQATAVRDQVWQAYVQQQLIAHECEALGLCVTDAELERSIQAGESPLLAGTPFRAEDGKFDYAALQRFREQYAQMSSDAEIPADTKEYYQSFMNYWKFIEKQIRQELLASKYQGLIASALLSNPVAAKQSFEGRINESDVLLCAVPYTSIKDADVEVSDKELKAKYEEMKEMFRNDQEMRDIKYIDVEVKASKADEAQLNQEMAAYAAALQEGAEPAKVVREAGSLVPYSVMPVTTKALPRDIAQQMDSMSIGEQKGPYYYAGDNTMNIVRIISHTTMPDSVQFRQLAVPGVSVADAQQRADSIMNVLRSGVALDSVAKNLGQNAAPVWLTSAQYDGQNMDETNRLFIQKLTSMPAGTTETFEIPNQGVAILNVMDRRNTVDKYNVAVVKVPVDFSKETYSAAYNQFSSFIAGKNAADLESQAQAAGYAVQTRQGVSSAEHTVANVSSTREALRWIFNDDTKVGDVSPLYECGNNDHLLVIILDGIHKKGYLPWDDEDVKNFLTQQVLQDKKAAMLQEKMQGITVLKDAQAIPGAATDTLRRVSFSGLTYVPLVGTLEPAVAGAVSGMKQGEVKCGIRGNGGVYALQVLNQSKQQDAKYDQKAEEQQNVQMNARALQSLTRDLFLKADVQDNRYLFY